jgi:SsrA-binding protein
MWTSFDEEPETITGRTPKSNRPKRIRVLPAGTFHYTLAMAKKPKSKTGHGGSTIALNKKAGHDYHIEQRFEAGMSLEGWEVKSLRAGRVQLKEAYVRVLHGEAFLLGCHISALSSASSHVQVDPIRTRKLLLKRSELNRLIGLTERAGYTLVPTAMYWKRGRAKLEIGLAKGKKLHDKRASAKDKDWQREKERLFKKH